MNAFVKDFLAAEDGAVTVDWVVLTAALVGLGLAVIAVVSGGIESLSNDIDSTLDGMSANDQPFGPNASSTTTTSSTSGG